jgi:hypothetical protein
MGRGWVRGARGGDELSRALNSAGRTPRETKNMGVEAWRGELEGFLLGDGRH